MSIVKTAKSLGVELFVLDDGWFGERNDDTRSLGDWYPNLEKLPDGITGIAKRVEAEGMKFGLWFEPEMVNKNSHLTGNTRTGSWEIKGETVPWKKSVCA